MSNEALRQEAAKKGIKLWQIANEIGIADTTFSKWMRKELSADRKKIVHEAIRTIAARQEAAQ